MKSLQKVKFDKGIILFITVFSVLTVSYYLLLGLGKLLPLTNFFASQSVALVKLILSPIFKNLIIIGNTIALDGYAVNVNAGCDGTEVIGIFIFAVLAFPVNFIKKLPAIIAGSIFIFSLNLIRIIALFIIGLKWNDKMDLFHNDIFPFAIILIEFAMWYLWVKWTKK